MMVKKIFISGFLFFFACSLWSKPLTIKEKKLESSPPRIIRTCCAFGSDMPVMGVPFMKISHISSIENMGPHKYLGSREEGNGLIYTRRGGFIDLGHLRDQADWTAYIFALVLNNYESGVVKRRLGYEGGAKTLNINIPARMDSTDVILLAGRIAYDLSVWHEISTWFGASVVPMLPERYSSFSAEDLYSNLLGVTLGIKALKSKLPYEEAMTTLLAETLDSLGAVNTEEKTREALEEVHNIWWTRDKRIPNQKVLIERHLDAYNHCQPWLIPGESNQNFAAAILQVPEKTSDRQRLTSFYELRFNVNHKFPFEEIFPSKTEKYINQNDFPVLLDRIEKDLFELNAGGTEMEATLVNKKSNNPVH